MRRQMNMRRPLAGPSTATPEEIRATAEKFFSAYRMLDVKVDVIPPKVVCLAMAVELILKALLAAERTGYGRVHSLHALFEELSDASKEKILKRMDAPRAEFLQRLAEEETAEAFIRWRYIYEVPPGDAGNTWTGCLNQLYTSATTVLQGMLGTPAAGD